MTRRILILADAFPVLSETFVADHVRAMVADGWDVTLMVRRRRRNWHTERDSLGHKVVIAVSPPAGVTQYLRAIFWQIRHPMYWANLFAWKCALHGARIASSPVVQVKWDVVHAHFGHNGVSAIIAAAEWRTRLIVNFHGSDVTATPARYGWRVYRRVLGPAHAVAHSGFVERLLLANTQLAVHRVTMGVDLKRFWPPPKPTVWPRPLRLLCVGRLSAQKGQAVAIDALKLLRTRRPELDVSLTLIGPGRTGQLQARAKALGLSANLHGMAPSKNADLPAIYRNADILLVPSQPTSDGQQEAFCRTAVEGMACGLPVAGTPGGGLPETIGEGGLVSNGYDARAIADVIEHILEQKSPNNWCLAARTQASRYCLDRMNAEYAEVAGSAIKSSSFVD